MADEAAFVNAFVDERELVLLYRRESDGRLMQRRSPADWASFYEATEKFEEQRRDLAKSAFVRRITREGNWYRVSWVDRWVRKKAVSEDSPLERAGCRAHEGDVDPVARYFADTGARIAKPRRVFLDIETDSRVPPRLAAEGKARVLMWALTRPDETSITGVLEEDTDAAEKVLLDALAKAMEEFDQVAAWNGDEFDFTALVERMKQRRVSVDWRRWVTIDQMVAFERMNMNASESGEEKVSLALGKVCQRLLGEGKDEFNAAHAYQEWAAGGERRATMVRYMIKDTVLQARLDKKTGYLDIHQAVSEVCRVFPNTHALHPTRFVDGYMLRLAVERGIHFGTRRFDSGGEEKTEQFSGAWCMEPKAKGFVENVHVCDFKSLYPSIILTWNMSPDTKVWTCPVNGPIPPGVCRTPSNRKGFRTDAEGILPGALRELMRMRDVYKKRKKELPPNTPEWVDADRLSMGYKVAANSFYGVMGSPFSRFFDRDIAEGVTTTGVWLLQKVIAQAETPAWALRCIYGDTDSGFIAGKAKSVEEKERFADFVKSCNEDLFPTLTRDHGCVTNVIVLDYEKAFERMVFTSKKRYVGRFWHYGGKDATPETKPEVVGLEWMRGDANRMATSFQYEVIQLIAGPSREASLDVGLYVAACDRWRTKVFDTELTVDEVSQAKGLGKDVDDYEVKKKKDGTDSAVQPHVSVAKMLIARGEHVTPGNKIAYVIVDGSKEKTNSLVCVPAADYDGTNVDRHYLWEHMVWPPVGRLLEACFPDHDWSSWERSLPPKNRKVAPGQTSLSLDVAVTVPRAPSRRKKPEPPDQGGLFGK